MDDFQKHFYNTLSDLNGAYLRIIVESFPGGEKYDKEIKILKTKVPQVLGDLAVELGLSPKTALWPFGKNKPIEPLSFLALSIEAGASFEKTLEARRQEKKVKHMLDSVDEFLKQVQ